MVSVGTIRLRQPLPPPLAGPDAGDLLPAGVSAGGGDPARRAEVPGGLTLGGVEEDVGLASAGGAGVPGRPPGEEHGERVLVESDEDLTRVDAGGGELDQHVVPAEMEGVRHR